MHLGLVLAALVLSSSFVSAQGARIEGILEFSRALHEGLNRGTLRLDAAYGNGSAAAPLRFDAAGHAVRMVVNWTFADRAGAGSAADDPEGSLSSAALGPARSGERVYANVSWNAAATMIAGNWLLVASDPLENTSLRVDGLTSVFPSDGTAWVGGTRGTTSSNSGTNEPLRATKALPKGRPVAAAAGDAAFGTDGTQTLYLWGVELRVDGDTHRSGTWTTAVVGDPVGPRGVARVERAQLLRIEMQGTLSATVAAETVGWTGPAIHMETSGRVGMQGSKGALRVDDALHHYDGSPVVLEGKIVSDVQSTDATSLLRTTVHSDDRATEILTPPKPVAPTPDAIRPKSADGRVETAFGLLAVVGLVSVVGGVLARRRLHAGAFVAAERALIAGRPRRAAVLLRGHLTRQPDDLDAWFLLGAGVLQDEGPDALVGMLEPVARRLPTPRRSPLSFLLALAFADLGRADAAFEWLRDAANDPAYVARAGDEPAFHDLQGDVRFQRIVHGGTPAYA